MTRKTKGIFGVPLCNLYYSSGRFETNAKKKHENRETSYPHSLSRPVTPCAKVEPCPRATVNQAQEEITPFVKTQERIT